MDLRFTSPKYHALMVRTQYARCKYVASDLSAVLRPPPLQPDIGPGLRSRMAEEAGVPDDQPGSGGRFCIHGHLASLLELPCELLRELVVEETDG